jgi:hypothetical protein
MFWLNKHRRTLDRLSDYFDGELRPDEKDRFEVHLASCRDCRRQLDELRATVLALREMPEVEAPRSFALTPDQVARPAPRPSPTPRAVATGARLAAAGLAFALAAVVFVDVGNLTDGGGASMNSERAFDGASPESDSNLAPDATSTPAPDSGQAPDDATPSGEPYGDDVPDGPLFEAVGETPSGVEDDVTLPATGSDDENVVGVDDSPADAPEDATRTADGTPVGIDEPPLPEPDGPLPADDLSGVTVGIASDDDVSTEGEPAAAPDDAAKSVGDELAGASGPEIASGDGDGVDALLIAEIALAAALAAVVTGGLALAYVGRKR